MTVKEKARNYVWSRIQSTERDLKNINVEMSGDRDGRISMDILEKQLDATDRRLDMFNYLFKLIETDED